MYKQIEELYKKESSYNKIKKSTFVIYFLGVIISLGFSANKNYLIMLIVMFLTVYFMLKRSEKVLKVKLYFNIFNKKDGKKLNEIISDQELTLFKNYLIDNEIYNKESLMCILEHYRSLIKPIVLGNNLLSILSVILPILIAFINKDGFDSISFQNAIPYIVAFLFMIIMIYFCYNTFLEAKKFFKGEDGMYERLEEIFSELYIECVNYESNKKGLEKDTIFNKLKLKILNLLRKLLN